MRPAILILLCLLTLSASVWADDARERKVKVALALAASAQCGECRFDEVGCRDEASKTGKPLVLFVGGPACSKCGASVKLAGGIPCVVDSYDGDKLGTKPRAVILLPKPAGGWWIEATLVGFDESKVKSAVEKAKPKPPAPTVSPTAVPLNWQI